MKTDPPTVHCIFAEDAPPPAALVQSSFQLYLKHILAVQGAASPSPAPEKPVKKDVP